MLVKVNLPKKMFVMVKYTYTSEFQIYANKFNVIKTYKKLYLNK